jgi:hypothetical protein
MRRLRPWLVVSRVQVGELLETTTESNRRAEGLRIDIPSRGELLQAARELPDELTEAFIDDAASRGDVCVAAFHGGHVVAWAWRSFTTAPHADGVWVRLDPPYCYSYKWYTRPEYRGRRVLTRVCRYGDELSRDRGCRRAAWFIETHNYPSLRASRRLGARTVGYAGYLKLFGKSYPFRTPGVLPHGFRFYRNDQQIT